MTRRTVLTASGPSRLARLTGVLRHGDSEGSLVLEVGGSRTPIMVVAPHTVLESPALLADADGIPVVSDGERVELVGGFAPEDHPNQSAFFASRVSVLDPWLV